MSGPGLNAYLLVAGLMFCVGLFGVLTRRNLLAIVVSVELMANAANLNLVAYGRFTGNVSAQATALFALALTVAEVVVGLALVILVARSQHQIDADAMQELKG